MEATRDLGKYLRSFKQKAGLQEEQAGALSTCSSSAGPALSQAPDGSLARAEVSAPASCGTLRCQLGKRRWEGRGDAAHSYHGAITEALKNKLPVVT